MKILIAIDDSPYTKEMLTVVEATRWSDNVMFKIVTVLEPLCVSEDDATDLEFVKTMEDVRKRRMTSAERFCDVTRKRLLGSLPVTNIDSEIREGSASAEIVNAAIDWNADKIVIGAHRQNVCPHFMLGSVSRAVASNAPCSVEIIRSKISAKGS